MSDKLVELAERLWRESDDGYSLSMILAALTKAYDLGRAERDREWFDVVEAWRMPESLPDCPACAALGAALDAREAKPGA